MTMTIEVDICINEISTMEKSKPFLYSQLRNSTCKFFLCNSFVPRTYLFFICQVHSVQAIKSNLAYGIIQMQCYNPVLL